MSVLVWSAVMVIGGVGSVTRFVVDRAVSRRASGFPFGTLAVNLTGAVLLGLISGLALGQGTVALSHTGALLAGTAFVGAYTTFSTWMFETHRLAEERRNWAAVVNIVGSVVLGVAAAGLGIWIAGQL